MGFEQGLRRIQKHDGECKIGPEVDSSKGIIHYVRKVASEGKQYMFSLQAEKFYTKLPPSNEAREHGLIGFTFRLSMEQEGCGPNIKICCHADYVC